MPLYGVCDIIELHAPDAPGFYTNSIYPGKWSVYPVEYKHGKPKDHDSDLLQRHLRDYGEQVEMRNISERLKAYQSKIWTADSKDTLRGYEGQCSRLYFQSLII